MKSIRNPPAARFLLVLLPMTAVGIAHAQSDREERPLTPFSKLRVENGIDVYLTQADEAKLVIEVEDIDFDDIVTEVVDDELRISRAGGRAFGFLEGSDVTAYLDFVRLSDIDVSGGSDVEGRNTLELERLRVAGSGGSDVALSVNAQQLDFVLSGGSDLDVEGTTLQLSVEASGGSDVSARNLQAQRATLRLSGGSDASVDVRERIDVEAHAGSDVTVHGDPAEQTVDTDRSSDVTLR